MIEIGPHDQIEKLYNKPSNRKLKYYALAAICLSILLLLAVLIWGQQLSYTSLLVTKGFAGLFALIFAVLTGVLVYRVNKEYISNWSNLKD